MRWLRRISGIIWIFTWRTIYLEIFRWHHMTKSLRFNPPPPPPGTDIRPRAGAPLIAVCVGAVAAPLVFVTAAVLAARGQGAGLRPTPPYREFGRPAGRVPGSGRQRAIQTTPGSMSSKPSKNRSMSFTGRT